MAVGNTIGKLTAEPMLPKSTPAGSANPPEKKSWWSKWGDVVHTGLDILGAVPVVGIVADGANAAIYAAEGDYVNAAISGASAAANLIPGGGAAMKAGKAAVAVGKQAAKTVAKESAEALAKKAAKEAAEKAAKESAEKAAKEGAEAAGKKAAKKAGSDAGGGVKGKGKKAKKSCKNGACVGRPVNPVLGIKFLGGEDDLDFNLPAPLPLPWQRSYYSDQTGNGWLGQGWSLPLSSRLLRLRDNLLLVDEQGREIELPELDEGAQELNRYESVVLRRDANGRYRISSVDGSQHFIYAPLDLDAADPGGERANYLPLVAIEDRNGNRTRILYDESGLPWRLLDSAGRQFGLLFRRFSITAGPDAPRLHAVTLLDGEPDAAGNWPSTQVELLVRYDYDDAGDLVRVIDGQGKARREYAYREHVLVEHSRPGGVVARYEYDQYNLDGRVLSHTISTGQSWRFTYLRGETVVTDNLDRQTRYRFNADTELTGIIDEMGGETRIELDAWGNPTTVTDAAGRSTRYHYDDDGNTSAIVDPAGGRTEVQYHEQWRLPIMVTNAMGAVTRYDYDAAGNLIRETDALGQATSYNHDERGLVVRMIDAHGGKRRLEYDAFGQPVTHIDCVGHTTRYRWDSRGNQLAVEHADGTVTEYAYDGAGRLQQVRLADGSSESFAYDDAGRMIRHVDTGGSTTAWEFAADGVPVARINALGQRLGYEYDAARRLVVLTNENGAYYRLAYDAKNNLVGEQGFDGRVSLYRYDAADNLTEQRDLGIHAGPGVDLSDAGAPELLRTQYRRDPAGRVVEKITGRAKDKKIQRSQYEYDLVGRIVGAVNEGGRVTLVYDEIGQLVEESSLTLGRMQSLRHSYDGLGNRVETVLPDGRRVVQRYYGPGYLHRVEVDGRVISDIERDAMQRETVRSQGAITSYFDYDVMGRLTGQRARKDGISAEERVARRYVYDRGGNLLASTDKRFGQIAYQYDPLGRLTRANGERFSFDPAHNLVDREGTSVRNNRVPRYEDKQFDYDTHGNLVEKRIGTHTSMRLSYDPEHQLVAAEVVRNGVKQRVTYGYDALGRRSWKRDGFGTTEFLWDGNRLLQEIRQSRCLVYLYEPSGFVPFAQLESAAPGTVEKVGAAPSVRYFHNDQIGTPRELSESDGRISWRASYRAWGNTLVVEYPEAVPTVSEVHQPLRFQGQYYDAETGLHYNRFRYYDPDVGRFVSQDPVGMLGGENLFAYAPNPTGWIDPNGLAKKLPSGTYATHSNRTKTPKVNGRNVINKCYAGKVFPAEHLPSAIRGKYPHGVPFNMQGFPDFSRYATKTVNIKLGSSRTTDFGRANRAAFGKDHTYGSNSPTINGTKYTWHHHQEAGKMQLIPEDIHDAVKHTGGVACDI